MRLLSDVASRVDDPYLRHAVALAERARGRTAPNPLVGCVIVSGGEIVGEGYHPRAGEAHAEVFALADAGPQARNADVYVTLEPCRHHGRTPPCTDALIAAGVRRVVIGMADPSPEAGGGANALRDAGIEVAFADDPKPFFDLNEGWLKRISVGLPFVTVKVGATLDGRVAFVRGERASITGDSGAEITRRARAGSDAVLVGAATVRADDPALTLRDAHGARAEHQPTRFVLAGSDLPPADAAVFNDDLPGTVLLIAAGIDAREFESRGATVIEYDPERGITSALRAVGDHGVNDLLVEAGPTLLGSLWREGLIDELLAVTAGGMGGADAVPLYFGEPDREDSSLVPKFRPRASEIVGDVAVATWRRAEDF